ncbi:MAG TPA: hypothetical protein VLD37_03745 [Candidatus Bilamarchaeum sp.]|nr:hypothetical protein [Candidatus Bilamarchaeum sp.]
MEIIPALMVISLFSLCGMTGGGPAQQPVTGEGFGGDCGVFSADGQDCFEASMQRCAPAKVMLFEHVPPAIAEITGPQLDTSCAVTVRGISKAQIGRILAENSGSQEEIDDINARIDSSPGFSGLDGLTATCIVDKLGAEKFATSYTYSCNGPLIDEIRRLGLVEKFA